MPRIKAEVAADLKKNPPKPVAKTVITPKPKPIQATESKPKRNRNAGKQQHHK